MTNIDLLYAFELEAANIDNVTKDKLNSLDVLYWLNQGVDKFVKTRFDGDNSIQTSFELNEKRSRDLINLLTTALLDVSTFVSGVNCTKYTISYPTDLVFILNESVDIYENSKPTIIIPTDVFQCTLDNYMTRMTNSLTDFHMRNSSARPLRVRTGTGCILLTDGTYSVLDFSITYIRKPTKISLDNPFVDYTDFPDNVLSEIVKLSVAMYIENLKNSRYQTIENEINTME